MSLADAKRSELNEGQILHQQHTAAVCCGQTILKDAAGNLAFCAWLKPRYGQPPVCGFSGKEKRPCCFAPGFAASRCGENMVLMRNDYQHCQRTVICRHGWRTVRGIECRSGRHCQGLCSFHQGGAQVILSDKLAV